MNFQKKSRLVVIFIIAFSMMRLPLQTVNAIGARCYVNDDANGNNNGTSWANAYTYLHLAMVNAACTEIWVAAGTYKPTNGTDRTVSFVLKNGVSVYGGFAGTEAQLEERNWIANETILSGDLNGDDVGFTNNGENSYNVVVGIFLDESAILDGFTILAGNNDYAGGGVYLEAGNPTLRNLMLTENFSNLGGGMYTDGSNPSLTNVTFTNNLANYGGGISLWDGSSPTLSNVNFIGNTAILGGGIYSSQTSSPTLADGSFQDNSAEEGGGVFQQGGTLAFSGVTFDGNSAQYGGAMELRSINAGLIENSHFVNNTATAHGGGIKFSSGSLELSETEFNSNTGYGIHNKSGFMVLTRVTFENNQAGGMYNETSNSTLTDVTFNGNAGMGMYNENSSPVLTNVAFSNNNNGGLYNHGGAPNLTNVTLTGNVAYKGGGMSNDNSHPVLTNVTFSNNIGNESGGAIYNVNSSPEITNTIFWENETDPWGDGTEIWNDGSSSPTIIDSVVQGGCPSGASCTGIITADPLLGPLQENGGYTQTKALGAGSSAMDAGGVNSPCAGTDQRDIPRPQGSACDIGSFEYDQDYNSVLYAVPGGLTSGRCDNWANACELRYAIASAVPGHEIWVAAGTYKPTGGTERATSFVLKNGIRIYGGFVGTESQRSQRDPTVNETILSGDLNGDDAGFTNNGENSIHVVSGNYGANSTAVLDGFTIRGGNANGAEPNNMGGGLFNNSSSPALVNLVLRNNTAASGGGMYNHGSSPILTNVVFEGNAVTGNGGAFFNSYISNPTLTNVTFTSNSAGGNGGGIFSSEGSPILTNVTFIGNTAGESGGGMSSWSNLILTNVTFRDNEAAVGGGMYNSYCAPILNNVSFDENTAEAGGGMYNYVSSPTLNNVTFSENGAYGGGGMSNASGSNPNLTNVTFSGNSANGGGGMSNTDSNPALTNVTFNGNTAVFSGGGIRNFGNSAPVLVNVILWGNGIELTNESSGSVIKNSVVQGGCPSGSTCTDLITNDPLIGTFGNYGGFTRTVPLLPGSSAIDTGDDDLCPATDQRGIIRPLDGNNDTFATCDIGAFEVEYPYPFPFVQSIIRADPNPSSASYVNFTVTFSEPVTGVDAADFNFTKTGSITGFEITNLLPASGAAGVYTVTVKTGSYNGTLGLNLVNDGSIRDTGNNPLVTSVLYGQTYQITKSYSVTLRSDSSRDGWILEATETSNTGGSMNAGATTFNLGDDPQDRQYRAILSFNTGGLPDNAVITKVVLKIRKQGLVGTNPFNTHNGLKVDIRKLRFGTSPTLQVSDFQAAASKSLIGTFGKTPVNNWYSAILNKTAFPYINLAGVTQFRLRFAKDDNDDHGADYLKFFSGNALTASRPVLVITYYVP